jgi:hypothetical protein
MSGTTYCASGVWRLVWSSCKDPAAGYSGGIGLGDHLAPEKSVSVLLALNNDRQKGSAYALSCLIDAVWRKPLQAVIFKVQSYDMLWFGDRSCANIYYFSLIETMMFAIYMWCSRKNFDLSLVLFPAFIVGVSALMHYEPRYTQPFYSFITPITTVFVLQKLFERQACRQTLP